MLKVILKPQLLIGAGSLVLLGAGVYEYSRRVTVRTGFHYKDLDPSLRIVEKDVVIPKLMKELSRDEYCTEEGEAFVNCCKQYPPRSFKQFFAFMYCRPELDALNNCMNDKFLDYNFYLHCKELYLKDKKLLYLTKVDKKAREVIKDFIKRGEEPNIEMEENVKLYYDSVNSCFKSSKDINCFDEMLLNQKKT